MRDGKDLTISLDPTLEEEMELNSGVFEHSMLRVCKIYALEPLYSGNEILSFIEGWPYLRG